MWSIYTHTHTHTHTEIMPFAATCMDLEITILNDGRETQIPGDTTYVWNLKMRTKKFTEELI